MRCELCGGPTYYSGMDVPEDGWMEVWICETCGHANGEEVGTVTWWLELVDDNAHGRPHRAGGGEEGSNRD